MQNSLLWEDHIAKLSFVCRPCSVDFIKSNRYVTLRYVIY
jgi:hypothetical protein